jgi:hypothetical protein
VRRAAVLKRDGAPWVFCAQVGDAPERILLSRNVLDGDWYSWREELPVEVMRPEHPWEGASAPNLPSVRITAYGVVNQLRDPAIYEEAGVTYLLHAAGEAASPSRGWISHPPLFDGLLSVGGLHHRHRGAMS